MQFMSNQEQELESPSEDMLDIEMPVGEAEMMGVEISPDGSIVVSLEGDEMDGPVVEAMPFDGNLAELLPEEELDEIGAAIKELVERDKESRKEWYETMTKGLKALGVYNADDISETGLRRVTHPLLIEAATQFQARAMAELLPPNGPVKAAIVGKSTPELRAQSARVEAYMNYQLTVEDRTYYDERDQMFFLLAFSGSEFDKQYRDPTTGKVVSRWVRSDHFIAPYDAKNLRTSPRYTHEIHMPANDFRRAVANGFYVALDDDGDADDRRSRSDEPAPLTEELNKLDGQTAPATGDGAETIRLYETHIDYDLPGMEEDIALPYVITIEADTGTVVGLRRNWKESDPLRLKRVWFTHKKFLPGFGFYGFGLLHAIGGLGEAATEILRILLDSGAFATLQGGFKSKDARLRGDVTLEPGVWMDTEMTAEELARSFYTPPFKEPSQVLVALLGTITSLGQRFAATTETMVGDAATTGPVGTMVAQIEQGSKVFSGIHKRLHKAFGDEFINIAELNGEGLPEAYPFRNGDDESAIMRDDFDGRVDVIPVSDPNIFSTAQRLAMAQTALQLANAMPDISDRRAAAIGLLEAMRFPDPEVLFPKRQEAVRADPIAEGSMVVMGRPVKAYLDQHHQAHLVVHQGQMQALPEQQQPVMMAHMMEHMAMAQYMQFAQMGVPLPPMEFYPETGQPMYPDIHPQIETQIALAAAQAMNQLMQQQQQAQQQAEQAQQQQPAPDQQQQAQQQADEAKFVMEQQRKDAAFSKEQQRKDVALATEIDRKDALSGLSPQLVRQAEEFIASTGIQMSSRELAVLSKSLGRPFNEVVAALSRLAMAGSGGSQFQQTAEMHANNPRFK